MCCAEWIQLTLKNRQIKEHPMVWHWFKLDRAGRGGWAWRRRATPAWARATQLALWLNYRTAVCPLRWRPARPLSMPAAAGWRSCAAGVPAGRSAASVSSAPSSEKEKNRRDQQPPCTHLILLVLWSSAAFNAARWLVTKAAEYQTLRLKLGCKKFQRSSKVRES